MISVYIYLYIYILSGYEWFVGPPTSAHVACLKVVMRLNRQIHFILEQPAQSWGFKLPIVTEIKKAANMTLVDVNCVSLSAEGGVGGGWGVSLIF